MYFTAHGRAIPCCIAPFSMRGYDSFTLGNATQQSLREIWNGERYQDFRRALLSPEPPKACAKLRPAMEPVAKRPTVVRGREYRSSFPHWNEEGTDRRCRARHSSRHRR
jgi:hypothetical protein